MIVEEIHILYMYQPSCSISVQNTLGPSFTYLIMLFLHISFIMVYFCYDILVSLHNCIRSVYNY